MMLVMISCTPAVVSSTPPLLLVVILLSLSLFLSPSLSLPPSLPLALAARTAWDRGGMSDTLTVLFVLVVVWGSQSRAARVLATR